MEQKNNIVDSGILSSFEFHTKLSKEQRKTLINWFNKQNIEFQILIFDEQKNQFFKLKNEGIDKKLLSLASFLLAICKKRSHLNTDSRNTWTVFTVLLEH